MCRVLLFLVLLVQGLTQITKFSGREYHMIQEMKNWTEARDYCRSRYTDLVSIPSPEEGAVIANISVQGARTWIGLYNDEQSPDGWTWTTGEKFNYTHWAPSYPQEFNTTSPACVHISKDQWLDTQCDVPLPFICFTEPPPPSNATEPEVWTARPANISVTGLSQITKLSRREYHVIQEMNNWTEARDYCQRRYTDLVSIPSPEEGAVIANISVQGARTWIGLYNDEQSPDGWKWTTGEEFNYTHWEPSYPQEFNTTSPACVYISKDQWLDTQCDVPLPFICFTDAQQLSSSKVLPAKRSKQSGSGEIQRSSILHSKPRKYANSEYIQSIGTDERMYFLISQKKGWFEARNYCQLYYSDLLSIRNMEEAGIVAPLVTKMKWIGLHSDGAGGWTWTNGDNYQYTNWSPSYPYIYTTGLPVCIYATSDGWREEMCDVLVPFVCYLDLQHPPHVFPEEIIRAPETNGHKDTNLRNTVSGRNFKSSRPLPITGGDRVYFIIEEEKTWSKAWTHCRNHYTNLVSIRNAEETKVIAASPHGPQWIGLYNDGLSGWMWTNGDVFRYTNWALWHPYSYNSTLPMCGALFDKEWHEADCDFPFAFICYKGSFSKRMYHKILLEKTWSDARDYCQAHHTDLVSIRNKQENTVTSALFEQMKLGWCGLYNDQQMANGWKWANGDPVSYTNWKSGNPYRFKIISPVCVYVQDGKWSDAPCRFLFAFICYTDLQQHFNQPTASSLDFDQLSVGDDQNQASLLSETSSLGATPVIPNREYTLITKEKTWAEAQDYCRAQHTDLLSIQFREENTRAAKLLKKDTPAWIGLFNELQSEHSWMWTNGDAASFLNWDNFYPMDFATIPVCVIMFNGRWKDVPCDYKFPFICYTE